jgi:drug/metabolite transporter (DMT)-like permease
MTTTPSAPTGLDARAVAILLMCTVIWGGNLVAMKIALAGFPPFLQSGLRSVLAGLLLLAWCRWQGIALFRRDGTGWAGFWAGVLFAGEFLFLYWGLTLTTASHAVVLINASPFVVALGAHLLLPGDRLTGMKVIGLVAAFLGVCVTMSEGLLAPGKVTLIGDLLCFVGAVLWGATTVLVRATALRSATAEKTLLYQLVVSAPILLAVSLIAGEPGVTNTAPPVLAAFAYTVVIVAFISYTIWFWLVRTYPATKVSAFTFLSPCFGVLLSHVILGDPLDWTLGVGLGLVAFGIWLVNRPARA